MDRFSQALYGEGQASECRFCAECGDEVWLDSNHYKYEERRFCDKDCCWDWLISKEIIEEG